MAHIFKHPSHGAKGILVLTHKEVKWFTKYKKDTRFDWLNTIQERLLPKNEFKASFQRVLIQIKKKYHIGVHFGWHHDSFPMADQFDFLMGGHGTVDFEVPEGTMHIPLNSRSFISKKFKNHHYTDKYWDIINVSRSANFKKLDKFLISIRALYDQGKLYKILLVVPPNKTKNTNRFYHTLESDYLGMFSDEERQHFTLIKLDDKLSFWGLSHTQLIDFYNRSKFFTLFTQKEGESRVIAEAMLCGLPIIVKSDLQGGGRDYLNDQNSIQFDTYENAHEAFIRAVEKFDLNNFTEDFATQHLREDHSIETLKTHFNSLYESGGEQFDGELINTDSLSNRLPGHHSNVAWSNPGATTSDVLTKNQFNILIESLSLYGPNDNRSF